MLDPSIVEALNNFFLVVTFVFGSMVGSFLNVCICRMPKGESIVSPRSRCPKCGNGIAWYDNIPMLSWLILGARCRNCKEPISWQYPLVEAITAVLFCCVYGHFGFIVATPIYLVLVGGLVLVTFVDLTDWTIPDVVTIPGIFIGIVCSLAGMFYPASGLIVTSVFDALIGVVLGGGILYLLDKGALLLLKKRGMGFGDVKLLAMLGAFFGWKSILLILMISSFIGSFAGITLILLQKRKGIEHSGEDNPTGQEGHYIPFGPYLVIGGLIFLFFGPDLIAFYLGIMRVPESSSVMLLQ